MAFARSGSGPALVGTTISQSTQAELVKPQNDKLEYKFITLGNSLKALVISDKEADKAAACMDVNVGSLSNPKDVPGLAHFTEHMLFYSSEKYPKEDEYMQFVADHGGYTNAGTGGEHTTYYFTVNWNHLEPALDRLAQFFIAPCISEDGVEREVQAVESEHKLSLNSDGQRISMVLKATSNPDHPCSRFTAGNLETLSTIPRAAGLNPRDLVEEFYNANYSANLMKLAVVGRESVSELEVMVQALFSAVPNKGLAKPTFSNDVYLPEHLCKIVKVVPEADFNYFSLLWPVPKIVNEYRYGTRSYLSFLLGHEGEGSLYSLLWERGWVTGINAFADGGSFAPSLAICFGLTELGQDHVDDILVETFRYINLLREQALSESLFEERKTLRLLRFRFCEKSDAEDLVTSLSSLMQEPEYPDHDLLLIDHSVPLEYNEESIQSVLDALQPETMRVLWVSQRFDGQLSLREPITKTAYSFEDVPQDWLDRIRSPEPNPKLHLPHPNPFIPTNLEMLPPAPTDSTATTTTHPTITLQLPLVTLWHRQESRFPSPKAKLTLNFQCPVANESAETWVMTSMLARLVIDGLTKRMYPAARAGLFYSICDTTCEMCLDCSGFSDKLPAFTDDIVTAMLGYKVDGERFKVEQEEYIKYVENLKFSPASSIASRKASIILDSEPTHDNETLLAAAALITPTLLQDFHRRLFQCCSVVALVEGNMSTEAAAQLAEQVQGKLVGMCGAQAPLPEQLESNRVVRLPEGVKGLFSMEGPNPENENSAIEVVYQVGPYSVQRNSLFTVFVQLGQQKAFHELRTVQQLGYDVSMRGLCVSGVLHLHVCIQSATHTPAQLDEAVEAFLLKFCNETVKGLSQGELQTAVEELATIKLQRPQTLGHVFHPHKREVLDKTLFFDRQEVETADMRKVTLEQLVQFAEEVVVNPSTRRQLVVYVHGHPKAKSADTPADDEADTRADGADTSADDGADTPAASAASADGAVAPAAATEPTVAAATTEPISAPAGAAPTAADLPAMVSPSNIDNSQSAEVMAEGDKVVSEGEKVGEVKAVSGLPVTIITDIRAFQDTCSTYPPLGKQPAPEK